MIDSSNQQLSSGDTWKNEYIDLRFPFDGQQINESDAEWLKLSICQNLFSNIVRLTFIQLKT
jgi:hypothetical protein